MKNNILSIIMCLTFSSMSLLAQNTWIDNPNQDWGNPNNWTLGHVPTSAEHVVINSGTCQIPVGDTERIESLEINGGTFILNNQATLIIRDADASVNRSGFYVDQGGFAMINGKLDIADILGAGSDGVGCLGSMEIKGIVNINNCDDNGFGIYANSGQTEFVNFLESARVNIKNCETGMFLSKASSGNPTTINAGIIAIDSINNGSINFGIDFRGGYFENEGQIRIGKLPNNQSAIYSFHGSQDTFINESCGIINIKNPISNTGAYGVINKGYLYQDYNIGFKNPTDFVNYGFIQHNLDTFVNNPPAQVVNNVGYILGTPDAQYYVGVPVSPALEGSGTGLSIPTNQFYTDATLTVPAGLFDPITNTWMPSAAAEGLKEFYVRVQTDISCMRVMKITYELSISQPTIAGSSSACDFTNGKPTLNEVGGNACVDGVVNVAEALQLTPVMSAPSNPAMGYIYLDGSTNTLRYWNGGNWVNIN